MVQACWLTAACTGSGISSTHYTTDGTDPTLSSPAYTGAFNVNGASTSTTVKFRSWDYAGNAEAVNTQVIQAPPDTTPPATTIACNHAACTTAQRQPDGPAVAEAQYRYPGPKPRTREVAIVMLADAVESAARSMAEATPGRVEALVHDLSMKRLLDGQFDECDLTMRELELIERSMMKTLLAIYHGRIAYPSMSRSPAAAAMPSGPGGPAPGPAPAARSA